MDKATSTLRAEFGYITTQEAMLAICHHLIYRYN